MSTIRPECSGSDVFAPILDELPVRRWLIVAAFLLAEMVAFSLRFDTGTIVEASGTSAWLAGQSWLVGQFVVAVAVGALLFGGHAFATRLRCMSHQLIGEQSPWMPIAAHCVSVLIFFRMSLLVFERGGVAGEVSALQLGAWLASGVATFATLVAVAVPVAAWGAVARTTSRLAIGIIALAIVAILAGQLTELLWRPLATWTFLIVRWLLSAIYSPVIEIPERLAVGTTDFQVEIAPGCSGYEGIGLVVVFLAAFLWWFRTELRFPQSLLLLPLGVLLIWFANSVRIAALVVVGTEFSPDVAVNGFHSQAGWLLFNGVMLGLIALVWRSPHLCSAAADKSTSTAVATYPAASYLIPFLALVAISMTTAALSAGGIDRLYPLKVVGCTAAILYFRATYRRLGILQWTWSWQPFAIGALVFALWMALEPLYGIALADHELQASQLVTMSKGFFVTWIVFRAVGSILVVPFVEELAFRGFLTRRLIRENFESLPLGSFTLFSFLLSSLLFGLLHGRWIAGTLAGALFAMALYRRGRLMDAVVAHSTANCLVTCYVLASGEWAAWS